MSMQHPGSAQVWGAPAPENRTWGLRESITALGVAVVIAAFGGGAVYAATEGHSREMGGARGQFGPPPAPGRADSVATGADRSLHGEFVEADPRGGFRTVVSQRGTVMVSTATSITVRSADGYSSTFAMPPGAGAAPATVAVGEDVAVRGARTGQTITVTSISRSP